MDYMTIILATLAAIGVVALAFVSGYERGLVNGISNERQLADRRINGLLAQENQRKPKSQKAKRKATRKGSSGGALW